MRFFDRAIEIYEAGLRKFPDSFDLAYNKLVISLQRCARFCYAGRLSTRGNTVLELESSTRLLPTRSSSNRLNFRCCRCSKQH